jgi:hypothetical protein
VQGVEAVAHPGICDAMAWFKSYRALNEISTDHSYLRVCGLQCERPGNVKPPPQSLAKRHNSHVCDGERNMNHAHAPRRGAQCCTTSLAVPTGLWVRFGTVSPSGFACMAVHTTLEQQHTHAALHKEHGSICLWMCPHRPSHFSTSW